MSSPVFYKGGPRDGQEVPPTAAGKYSVSPDFVGEGMYRVESVDGNLVSLWHDKDDRQKTVSYVGGPRDGEFVTPQVWNGRDVYPLRHRAEEDDTGYYEVSTAMIDGKRVMVDRWIVGEYPK